MMSHSQPAGQQLCVNDLCVIMEELNKACVKWYNIGMQLGVEIDRMDAIKEQYKDHSDCLRETLKIWLKTCSPTWSTIVHALQTSVVGEVRLAMELEQKFCSTQVTGVAVTHHLAAPVPHIWTTPQLQSTIPLTQPPVIVTPMPPQPHISHPSLTTSSYPVSTPFLLLPPSGTASIVAPSTLHPVYSQWSQDTPGPTRPVPPTSVAVLPATLQLRSSDTSTLIQQPIPPAVTAGV